MKNDQRIIGLVILLSLLLGSGAGIISSTMTSRAIESYAAQLLNDQKLISLIPRKSPALPGTFEEAMKKNREASLHELAIFLPVSTPSALLTGWTYAPAPAVGVPVTSDGWILTTSTAFSPKANVKDWEVYVEGKRFLLDKAVRDPNSELVLVKLANAGGLPTVSFGKPENVESGATVIAWANAEDISATLLSAADKEVKSGVQSAEVFTTTWKLMDEVPAGAPMFSSDAELLAFAGSAGEAFPLHHAGGFVQDVLKTGAPKLAKLGATALDLSRAYNVSADISHGRAEGALLVGVPEGPAKSAGLQSFDIILDADGRTVTHAETLAEILADYDPGEIANMHIVREGNTMEISVTLGER